MAGAGLDAAEEGVALLAVFLEVCKVPLSRMRRYERNENAHSACGILHCGPFCAKNCGGEDLEVVQRRQVLRALVQIVMRKNLGPEMPLRDSSFKFPARSSVELPILVEVAVSCPGIFCFGKIFVAAKGRTLSCIFCTKQCYYFKVP